MNSRAVFLPEVKSTNEWLKDHAAELQGDEIRCCYAFCQSEGKGRNGRRFESPCGGLYLSVLVDTCQFPSAITLAACVSAVGILENFFGISLQIKWVNDILYQGRKCAGILAESFRSYLVIGIGVNVFGGLPASLSESAISICGKKERNDSELHRLAAIFSNEWMKTLDSNWLDEYVRKSAVLGKNCVLTDYSGEVVTQGIVRGFGKDGSIIMEENGILRPHFSGELRYSLRILR